MPNKVTITSVIGPAQSVTAQVFDNLDKVEFDFKAAIIRMTQTLPQPRIIEMALSPPVTGVTYTIATNVATIVMT